MITKKRVLVACGTSIATATVAANRVKQIADEAGIAVEVIQCKVGEIRGRVQTTHPHLIVAMTPRSQRFRRTCGDGDSFPIRNRNR
jgi:galactitol-specific phosphotransferase system IIB component